MKGKFMNKNYYDIKKIKTLGNAKLIIPIKESQPLVALDYLEDIAYGRKMDYNPHNLKICIEKQLIAFELIKQCFNINGFDELIPNENWWKSETIQEFIREILEKRNLKQ